MPIKSGLLFIVRRLRSHGAALACLVVGFAAADLTFVFADALLLRPPPGMARPEQLVRFYFAYQAAGKPTSISSQTSLPVYDALRGATRSFSGVAVIGGQPAFAILGDASRWVSTGLASSNYFAVLRAAAPVAGRFFAESDARTDNNEIVLTYRFWREAFGGDRRVIGQPLRFSDGSSGTIVGVAPERFRGVGDEEVDLWRSMPARLPPGLGESRSYWLTVIGRLQNGVRHSTAEDEARLILGRLEFLPAYAAPPPRIILGSIITARGPEGGVTRTVAFCSIAIVGILILAVIGNFVDLGLLRVIQLRRSLATRLALGAPASAIGRLVMTEQLAVALTACCIAVVLTELAWKIGGATISYLGTIMPDPHSVRSLGFAAGLAGAIGLAGGIVPAATANRIAGREALGSASTASPRAATARSILVTAQVALSVALVVCGVLVGRSFRHIRDTRTGIDTDRVVAITFDEAVQAANLDRIVGLQAPLRRLPGVEDVSVANFAPLLSGTFVLVIVPGRPTLLRSDHATAAFNRVTADFFRSMGTRIVAGRPFLSAEESNGARVSIVNATLARAGWPSGNAVGQCLVVAIRPDSACTTVVGVAEDARRFDVVHENVGMQVYVPLTSAPGFYDRRVVFVRTSPDPRIALVSVRRFLLREVPDLHGNARLLADIVEPQLRPWLLALRLFGFSGAVVLIVTGIGLYGTLAVAEAQRRPEMAIRMALGARTQDILCAIGGRAARDMVIGVAVGLLSAVVGSMALQSLAHDLTPADVGIVAVACALLICALGATALGPTRRALRADIGPLLRSD